MRATLKWALYASVLAWVHLVSTLPTVALAAPPAPASAGSIPPSAVSNPAVSNAAVSNPAVFVPESDKDMARAIAKQAFTEFDARRYEAAVERFNKALALYDAPTLRLGRGHAHAALRRLVLAAADYRAAATHEAAPGEPPSFAEARREASLKYGGIQPRVPRITLAVGDLLPLVTIDGRVVGLNQLNTSLLLDPGAHEIVFFYHGQRTAETVVLEEGANELIRFEATAAPSPSRPRRVDPRVDDKSGAPIGAAVISGVLLVSTVVAALVAANAWSEFEELDKDGAPRTERSAGRRKALDWTWVTSGLGAAALGSTGVTAYLWLDSDECSSLDAGRGMERRWSTAVTAGVTGTF